MRCPFICVGMKALAISGTTTYYSDASNGTGSGHDVGAEENNLSATVVVTGTATGTLTLEVSNLSSDELRAGADDWSGYTITIPAVSGAAKFNLELINFNFHRYRWKYVNATNSGTLTVRMNHKTG